MSIELQADGEAERDVGALDVVRGMSDRAHPNVSGDLP